MMAVEPLNTKGRVVKRGCSRWLDKPKPHGKRSSRFKSTPRLSSKHASRQEKGSNRINMYFDGGRLQHQRVHLRTGRG